MPDTSAVDRQLARFRPAARLGLVPGLHRWLLAVAAALLALSVWLWHPVPLMFAIFLGVVGLAERRGGPNIVAALDAYDRGSPRAGEVSITVTCWDTDDHYHAVVREPGQSDWTYEFVPQGWTPEPGVYTARVWRAVADGRPVLAVVDDGVLIPRYDPTRTS